MSDKLTEEKIEQLIFEEIEKLEEFKIKIKSNFNTANRKQIISDLGLSNDQDIKDIAVQSSLAKSQPVWKAFAGLDGDPELEDSDFKKAFGAKKTANAKFAQRTYKASNKGDSFWAAIGGKYNPAKGGGGGGSTYPTYADLLKDDPVSGNKVRAKTIQAAIDKVLANPTDPDAITAMKDYVANITANGKYTSGTTKLSAQMQVIIGGIPPGGGVKDPDLADRIIKVGKTLIKALNVDASGKANITTDVRKDTTLDFMGGSLDVSAKEFQADGTPASKSKADSSTIEVFRNLPGQTLEERFDLLANFGKDIAKGSLPSGMNAFQAANIAKAFVYVADLGRRFKGTIAGDVMETVIALLIEGRQSGGVAGGDDMQQAYAGGLVYYSSKFFQKGTNSFDQSWSAKNGLYNQMGGSNGNPVYYFYGVKDQTKDDASYEKIDIYILKLLPDPSAPRLLANDTGKKIGDGEKFGAVKLVQPNGDLVDLASEKKWYIYQTTSDSGKQVARLKVLTKDLKASGAPTTTLQVPTAAAALGGVENTANWLRDIVETKIKGTMQQIVEIHDHLQNTMLNTREYTAKKGSGKTAANYITQVASDMKDARQKMNDVFNVGEGTTAAPKTYVAESKLQSLDDLIAETIRDIKRKRKK